MKIARRLPLLVTALAAIAALAACNISAKDTAGAADGSSVQGTSGSGTGTGAGGGTGSGSGSGTQTGTTSEDAGGAGLPQGIPCGEGLCNLSHFLNVARFFEPLD